MTAPVTRIGVIAGHSHQPGVTDEKGVLYLNPGSAGPRRFSLPVAVGRLDLWPTEVRARIIELKVPPARGR